MLKFYGNLEININGHAYIFSLPLGVPYAECKDAALEMIRIITDMEKKGLEEAQKAAAEELEKKDDNSEIAVN